MFRVIKNTCYLHQYQANLIIIFFIALIINACQDQDLEKKHGDHLIIGQYLQKASSYKDDMPDTVLHYTGLALETAEILNFHASDKESYYLQGHAYKMQGRLSIALESLMKAESIIITAEPEDIDGDIYLLLASIYAELGQYDVALKYYYLSIKHFEKHENEIGKGSAYNNIALIYFRIADLPKAKDFNLKAKEIWGKVEYPKGLAAYYTLTGYILSGYGSYDSAIAYHRKAQEIYTEYEMDQLYANSFLNIGSVYLKQNTTDLAEEAFMKSLELSRDRTYMQIYVDGLNKLGQCYTQQERFTEASDTLFAGLELAKRINDMALLAEFYKHIAELYHAKNDPVNAYIFQQEYDKHKDSIFKKERALRIAEFQVLYDTEQMRKKNEQLEASNRRRLLYIYFTIAVLVLLFITVILVISRYKLKIKLLNNQKELIEKEISHRHNELSSITMHLYQKNESLNQLIDEIEKQEKLADEDAIKSLEKVKQSILDNLHLDEDWNRFKMHFNQVHEGFIDRLSSEYKNLTNHDLRHCAYIRMNLSTKEISRLMNISPASVQKSRVRLKKKLELGHDDNLIEFLIKF